METRKLYYEDCNLSSFTANILSCEKAEGGYLVALDATAFYPEGGGQAADTGVLGGVRVLHTREKDGQILHLCDGPLPVGQEVAGQIDWEARFDLMQQHTGEHILSGLIHQRFGYHNVGFHIGKDVMEVDFDGPISPDAVAELEEESNRRIWADLPVNCAVPSPEELEKTVYRTKRALPWPVRIVEIPGTDSCACCGVHTERTGRVGIIKILSCVKFHGGVRLEMVCGQRAYRYLARVFEENRLVSQTFSAKMLETGAAAEKASRQLAAEKFRATALEKRVFAGIAESYVNCEKAVHFEPGLNPGGVRELAEAIAAACGWAAVFSGADDGGYSYCLAAPGQDLRGLNRELTQTLNGRGGGKPAFQQGSLQATEAQIRAFFEKQ